MADLPASLFLTLTLNLILTLAQILTLTLTGWGRPSREGITAAALGGGWWLMKGAASCLVGRGGRGIRAAV